MITLHIGQCWLWERGGSAECCSNASRSVAVKIIIIKPHFIRYNLRWWRWELLHAICHAKNPNGWKDPIELMQIEYYANVQCEVWTLCTDELVVPMWCDPSSTPFARKCYDLHWDASSGESWIDKTINFVRRIEVAPHTHSVHALCNQYDRACRSSIVSLSTVYLRKYPRFNRCPVHVQKLARCGACECVLCICNVWSAVHVARFESYVCARASVCGCECVRSYWSQFAKLTVSLFDIVMVKVSSLKCQPNTICGFNRKFDVLGKHDLSSNFADCKLTRRKFVYMPVRHKFTCEHIATKAPEQKRGKEREFFWLRSFQSLRPEAMDKIQFKR